MLNYIANYVNNDELYQAVTVKSQLRSKYTQVDHVDSLEEHGTCISAVQWENGVELDKNVSWIAIDSRRAIIRARGPFYYGTDHFTVE